MRWTDEEVNYLIDNHEKPLDKLATNLKRTKESIKQKIKRLNLKESIPRWTDEEIKFLRDNYHRVTTRELRIKFKRSENAIRRKASALNLSKNYPKDVL